MAVAHRSDTSGTYASGTTSQTCNKPSGLAVDDILVAIINIEHTANVLTSPSSAGFTEHKEMIAVNEAATLYVQLSVLWKRATAADVSATDFTFSWSGFRTSNAHLHAFSGCTTIGNPFSGDIMTSATGSTTIPSVSYTAANGMGVYIFTSLSNTHLVSWPSGYTNESYSNVNDFGLSTRTDTAGATSTGTGTFGITEVKIIMAGSLEEPLPVQSAPTGWAKGINTSPTGTRRNTAEGQPSGTTVTVGNSGGSSGNAFDALNVSGTHTEIFSNAQAMHGTRSYALTASAASNVLFSYSTLDPRRHSAQQMYIYLTGYPSADCNVMSMAGGATRANLSISSDGRLKTFDDVSQLDQSAASSLPLNTWLRLDMQSTVGTTTSNGRVQSMVSLGDSPTAIHSYDSGLTVNTGTLAASSWSFGKIEAAPSMATMYVDDISLAPNVTTFIPVLY